MAKRNKTEYIFADSYIGNFTRYLMTRKDLMRVAASRDLETADAVLREFGYEESKELKDPSNLQPARNASYKSRPVRLSPLAKTAS